MKLKEIEKLYLKKLLDLYLKDEVKNIFFLVVNHLLKLDKIGFLSFKEFPVKEEVETKFRKILLELSRGCPIQYVLGEATFYNCKIELNKSVLIPRPETEELVDWSLKHINKKMNVLDLCTGSGCIAISIAKHIECIMDAIDISNKALMLAKKNARLNKVSINFIKNDILKNILRPYKYDVIISNPPYVLKKDKSFLHKNVVDFEPHLALFVNNENPFLFYQKIVSFSKKNLKNKGLLFFEINELFGNEIVNILYKEGFHKIKLKKDINGKDRMIKAEMK